MATKKYIVKLTPHDKFFFGGENTFGEQNQANYFVKSNYFPQQTGLLGLVRHQLLLQCNDTNVFKDNKIVNVNNKTNDLIGNQSFRVNEDFEFGVIKSLSPVFICDKGKDKDEEAYYFPANKEYQINEKDNYELQFLEIDVSNIPELLKYNPKYGGIKDLFINKKCDKLEYEYNDKTENNFVFAKHRQVGIRKKYEGGTDDKAYYLQTFLKFKDDFCFAFVVELEDTAIFKTQNIVIFGGEQQTFKMEVEPFDKEFNTLVPNYKKSQNSDKIVLVSDAYAEEDILDKCNFAITETIDFRFLETENITENFNKRMNDEDKRKNLKKGFTKSSKYNLYKKGSVFYYNNNQKEAIEKALQNDTFIKLGYNHFKEINKKQ